METSRTSIRNKIIPQISEHRVANTVTSILKSIISHTERNAEAFFLCITDERLP